MKESLKQKLNDYLKAQGGKVIPISQLEFLVRQWGYKISNYERRLRPSESPNVAHTMKNGAINGYYWKSAVATTSSYMTADQFMATYGKKEEIKQPQNTLW